MPTTFRKLGKKLNINISTLWRLAHGKEIEFTTLRKVLQYYDQDLAEEVDALLNYLRKSLLRRSKNRSKKRGRKL